MNPENMGQQIAKRHSSLWRKPLLYEKPVPKSSACHTQMNQLAATGISWRLRNTSIPTRVNQSFKQAVTKKTHRKGFSEILIDDESKSKEASQFLQTIRDDANMIDRSEKLVDGMKELKKMRLLTGKNLQRTKYPGVSRYNYIHNDYHERLTNPGFSRNFLGRIYTR